MVYYINNTVDTEMNNEDHVINSTEDMNISAYEYLIRKGTTYNTLFMIRKYSLPLICLFGILGNILSLIVFVKKSMRNSSCNLYLAARSISDTGFLISLFFVWLDFIDVPIFNKDGICQILLFLSNICSFLSVWFVLVITCENYIRICHAMKVQLLCNTRTAKLVILTGVIIALLFYNFPLWGTNVRHIYGRELCLTRDRYVDLEMIFIIIDSFLTLIIPVLIIFVILTLIICDSLEATKRYERLIKKNTGDSNQRRYTNKRKRRSPHQTVTRLLTSVSVTFVVLHTPNHVIRLKVVIETLMGSQLISTQVDRTLQQIFITMSYLNFSINSLVYLFCGQRFRSNFRNIFCKSVPCCDKPTQNVDIATQTPSEHISMLGILNNRDDYISNVTSSVVKSEF